MKIHIHQYKKYDWRVCTERTFLGEIIQEHWVIPQKFRICKKCGKAQEYFISWQGLSEGWQDLSEEAKKVLLKKIETGEIVERRKKVG